MLKRRDVIPSGMAQRDERKQTADDVSKVIDDVKTGGRSLPRDESGGCSDYGPDGIRHKGGVTLNRALARNVGTCRLDAKGEVQMGGPHEDESTDAGHRGGAARSSDEGSVMELERRGCVVPLCPGVNRRREEPRGSSKAVLLRRHRRQPWLFAHRGLLTRAWLDNGSRMR